VVLPEEVNQQPFLSIGLLFYSDNGNDCHLDDLEVTAMPEPGGLLALMALIIARPAKRG
jgi:hypothetical protein